MGVGVPDSSPSLDVYPLTDLHFQSNPLTATVLFWTDLCHSAHFVMTHCTLEAKPAYVRAVRGLIRTLRGQLKALRRLLLPTGTDDSPRRLSFDDGLSGLLDRTNKGPVLDCHGPTHPSMAVSSHCVSIIKSDFKQRLHQYSALVGVTSFIMR